APALGLASGAGLLALALRERRLRPQEPDGGDHPAPTYSIPAIATMAAWLLAALAVAAALHQLHWRLAWPGAQPGASAAAEWRSLLKLLVWFTWPAWPLALWTLWRWRLQLTARHVAVPLWLVLV